MKNMNKYLSVFLMICILLTQSTISIGEFNDADAGQEVRENDPAERTAEPSDSSEGNDIPQNDADAEDEKEEDLTNGTTSFDTSDGHEPSDAETEIPQNEEDSVIFEFEQTEHVEKGENNSAVHRLMDFAVSVDYSLDASTGIASAEILYEIPQDLFTDKEENTGCRLKITAKECGWTKWSGNLENAAYASSGTISINGNTATLFLNADDVACASGVFSGMLYLEGIEPSTQAESIALANDTMEISESDDGIFEDSEDGNVSLYLYACDSETMCPIENAVFEVGIAGTSYTMTAVTDSNGNAVFDGLDGRGIYVYYWALSAAPEGYKGNTTRRYFVPYNRNSETIAQELSGAWKMLYGKIDLVRNGHAYGLKLEPEESRSFLNNIEFDVRIENENGSIISEANMLLLDENGAELCSFSGNISLGDYVEIGKIYRLIQCSTTDDYIPATEIIVSIHEDGSIEILRNTTIGSAHLKDHTLRIVNPRLSPVSTSIEANVRLFTLGGSPGDTVFTVTVKPVGNAPEPKELEAYVLGNGKADFGMVEFRVPGTYQYTLKQKDVHGIKCDNSEITVSCRVYATDSGKELQMEKVYSINGLRVENAEFKNIYKEFKINVLNSKGKPLSGCVFTLHRKNGEQLHSWSSNGSSPEDISNYIEFSDTYVITQQKAGVGTVSTDSFEFSFNSSGTAVLNSSPVNGQIDVSGSTMTITGREIKCPIRVTDVHNKLLNNARLSISEASGTVIKNWISGRDTDGSGVMEIGSLLECGKTYYLSETGAPVGYKCITDVEFLIDENGEIRVTEPTKVGKSEVVDGILYIRNTGLAGGNTSGTVKPDNTPVPQPAPEPTSEPIKPVNTEIPVNPNKPVSSAPDYYAGVSEEWRGDDKYAANDYGAPMMKPTAVTTAPDDEKAGSVDTDDAVTLSVSGENSQESFIPLAVIMMISAASAAFVYLTT